MNRLSLLLAAASLAALAGPASARGAAQPVFAPSDVPVGWVQFCQERPGDCSVQGRSNEVVTLTPERAAELAAVNQRINRTLKPVPDMEHYGVAQRWTIPTDGMGSCHHYMLMKRQALQQLGWPQSALLVTVVLTKTGIGHAVLTVRTNRGDLVLDNLDGRILPWNRTGYRYLMRQSQTSPNSFVSLGQSWRTALAAASRTAAAPSRALPAAWWQASAGPVWHPWQ
jgi:predicted transglutaminase-like cysteine proteinase